VLTAHPTEVQRKSILDAEREIARLLAERDLPLTPRERATTPNCCARASPPLWQTRMLRYTKLTVADEIENALSYYRITFLRELPALYDDIEADIDSQLPRARRAAELPPYLQMGSWIGGDRDGNPTSRRHHAAALKRQATTIFDYYLDEVHTLGAELSISTLMVAASPELLALADASPDHSEHRADEPYRRALIGIYARLAATARALGVATSCARKSVRRALRQPGRAWPTWRCWSPRCTPTTGPRWSSRAWPAEARRGNLRLPPGHAGHAPELGRPRARAGRALAKAQVEADYAGLTKSARSRCCWANCATAPAVLAVHAVSDETERAGHPARGPRDPRRYGERAIRNYIISHTETVSDLLEVLLLQKEPACCASKATRQALELMVIPLFETIPTCAAPPASCAAG
jgi:phosphoenolpyruvate carboxylase